MDRHPKPLVASAFLLVGALLCLLSPLAAAAQPPAGEDPETLAEARRIFGEGLAHSDRHEWHEAVAAFRQVIELRSAPPVLYNLAIALVEIGAYPEAQDLIERVLADETTSPEIHASAEALRGEMEAQGGKVEVAYRGDPAGVVFFIDGFALGGTALERPNLVAPGAHTFTARRGATALARVEADVVRGETTSVDLSPPDAPLRAELAEPEPASAAVPSERSLAKNPWLWTGVGVGVAVVVTVVLAVTLGGDGDVGQPFDGNFTPGRLTW